MFFFLYFIKSRFKNICKREKKTLLFIFTFTIVFSSIYYFTYIKSISSLFLFNLELFFFNINYLKTNYTFLFLNFIFFYFILFSYFVICYKRYKKSFCNFLFSKKKIIRFYLIKNLNFIFTLLNYLCLLGVNIIDLLLIDMSKINSIIFLIFFLYFFTIFLIHWYYDFKYVDFCFNFYSKKKKLIHLLPFIFYNLIIFFISSYFYNSLNSYLFKYGYFIFFKYYDIFIFIFGQCGPLLLFLVSLILLILLSLFYVLYYFTLCKLFSIVIIVFCFDDRVYDIVYNSKFKNIFNNLKVFDLTFNLNDLSVLELKKLNKDLNLLFKVKLKYKYTFNLKFFIYNIFNKFKLLHSIIYSYTIKKYSKLFLLCIFVIILIDFFLLFF